MMFRDPKNIPVLEKPKSIEQSMDGKNNNKGPNGDCSKGEVVTKC